MKNIIFAIKTAYSKEEYFLTVNEEHSIEYQIDIALAEICFCDNYEIVSYKEATKKYITKRAALVEEFKTKYGELEEAFCSGNMVTLETLKNEIAWREIMKGQTVKEF